MSQHQESKLFSLLKDVITRKEESRRDSARLFRSAFESELEKLASADSRTKLVNDLTARVFDYVNSQDFYEKLAGIALITELIELKIDSKSNVLSSSAHEPMIIRFANCLSILFQQSTNQSEEFVLEKASEALGCLAQVGGQLTFDMVNFQVKQSLEWLQGDASERRRLAAVLVLKQLAIHVPTLFNVTYFLLFG